MAPLQPVGFGRFLWPNLMENVKKCKKCEVSKPATKEFFHQAWNYANLQPLWAIDNMKKGGKYEFLYG